MKEINIIIWSEHSYAEIGLYSLPYLNVMKCVDDGVNNILTHCLDFLSFEYLDKGYDVILIKANKEGINEVLRLSELLNLEKCKQYTDKEIRKSHNVLKMFKAGAFKLKGE